MAKAQPPIPRASVISRSRLPLLMLVPMILVVVGTTGYHAIEGWPLHDCLYMTVITLTTVGFSEIHPMSVDGRTFTIILALGGVFTLFWTATEVVRSIAHGEFQFFLGRQRMERRLADIKDHYVVCGLGRMGRLVCQQFDNERLPYVGIDSRQELIDELGAAGSLAIVGDATHDDILERAGVERARGLVACAGSDADNVFIAMSARMMNEKLVIVARAENEASKAKLQRAGATRVVSPYTIGGERLAQAMLRPNVVDFIDLATQTEHLDLQIEEVKLAPGSKLVGTSLKDSGVRHEYGAIIVAVKSEDGSMVYNPGPNHKLAANHRLIVLAKRAQLDRLAEAAGCKRDHG